MIQHCFHPVGWKRAELLHSSHSVLCSFVLQVGRRLLFCFFLQCTLLCKQTWNSCGTSLAGDAVFVFLPRPQYAGEFCKQRFYFKNVELFSVHTMPGGEIWKRHFHFENASIPSTAPATPVISGFVFEKNPGDIIIFGKLGFRNVFRRH